MRSLFWLGALTKYQGQGGSNLKSIFNFGVTIGAKVSLNLYKSDSTGEIIQKNTFELDRLSLLHDFVLAGQYLVFFVPPIKADKLSILLGFKTFSDAMQWQPELGTRILIFDRDSLQLVSESVTDSWFQWHFANGCVNEQGNLEIVFVRYDDPRLRRSWRTGCLCSLSPPAP